MVKQKGKPGVCSLCHKEKPYLFASGASQGACKRCYRKFVWTPKLIECKRCNRMKKHHALGFCPGCYNSIFHIENVRGHNARRYHGIDPEIYKRITQSCVSCDFNKIVDLHHLDHNRENRSENNLIGLCPNCHKMLHSKKYQSEIFTILKQKGYSVPEGNSFDNFFKK